MNHRNPKNQRSDNFQDSGSVLPLVLLTGFLLMSLLMGILGVIAFDHLLDLKRFREKQLALACYSAAQQNIAGCIQFVPGELMKFLVAR